MAKTNNLEAGISSSYNKSKAIADTWQVLFAVSPHDISGQIFAVTLFIYTHIQSHIWTYAHNLHTYGHKDTCMCYQWQLRGILSARNTAQVKGKFTIVTRAACFTRLSLRTAPTRTKHGNIFMKSNNFIPKQTAWETLLYEWSPFVKAILL